MATAPNVQLSGIMSFLVQSDLLTESDAKIHDQDAKKYKISPLSYLVSHKLIDSKAVAEKIAIQFGLPFLDLDAIDCRSLPPPIKSADTPAVKGSEKLIISEKLIRQHNTLPLLVRGKSLFIALSDPSNSQVIDDIKFHSLLNPKVVLVEENKLAKAIELAIETGDSIGDMVDEDFDNIVTISEEGPTVDINADIDEAPIVRFVNKVLLDSIKKGVSDIHFEPYEKTFRIRFRTDGMLHTIVSPPPGIANRIVSRIKVMSKMDIAERRIPQDGRIKLILSKNRAIDFRVNTCPTLFGEKVVMRILDPTNAQLGVEKLGFEPIQQELFLEAINRPYGLVLVTGPTGSGKTVTLYTGLNILNTTDVNISTAEDPVEITVEGINQVNVNPKAGLTFANALRAFLRQDPDIIMVGEIRDLETAEIAVKAAQTGHMVLSTLHTNDAPQTLNRLLQMGIPAFNVVSSVNLIMAQRLGRRLCVHCKKEVHFPPKLLMDAGFKEEELSELHIFGPVGCDLCTNGYKGRVGIYQVMKMTEKLRELILNGANAMEIANCSLAEGFNDLRRSGLNKVRMGMTSLEEIDRITKE
ncbi:MAG: type IV-A pilus assembly ATPase PilB [Methylococcales bacterium]|nr:type IV-A pilus assembly ATPase PilB [Methylococcales bacterium]